MSKRKTHGGKGDERRRRSVSFEEYSNNWDKIFGKKETTEELDARLTKEYGGVYTEGILAGSELTDQEREEE